MKALTNEQLVAMRLSHLNMIQAIILRMSGFSASAKNFCITLLGAIIGISFQRHLPMLIPAAAFIVMVFLVLDVYYLAQERRFRLLYDTVAKKDITLGDQLGIAPDPLAFGQYLKSVRSFSTGGYYALLLIAASVIICISDGQTETSRSAGNSGHAYEAKSVRIEHAHAAEVANFGSAGGVAKLHAAQPSAERAQRPDGPGAVGVHKPSEPPVTATVK
jgi:hypothetical protein